MNSGDTAWVLASTALVLLMTLPGLALFYGGLVRSRSVLSVMMQCFAIAAAATLLWLIIGYSLSFGNDLGGVLGGANKVFFDGVTADAQQGSIPEIVFAMFQMTFAIITPALIVGAYVERIKFPAVLLISAAWVLLVYAPICHWVWGNGWLQEMKVMDFAGGLVVHLSAGVSALVIAAMLGRRQGFPGQLQPPHNPGMTAAGAALLWVGWFGFNGGSQLAADGGAGMAIAATHIAAAAGAASWSAVEWLKFGKPSLVGAATGVIAGLATVTPASGFVGPAGGLILGAVTGVVCFFMVDVVKERLKIDDSLDVFAVHGIGGAIGVLLVSVLSAAALQGGGVSVESGSMLEQLGVQALALAAVVGWAAVLTFVIVEATSKLTRGIKVDEQAELEGLDLTAHGERGYDL